MEEAVTRKLAAIMFTDIKGFSKKMGENESAAFEILKTHDALMRVMVNKNGGKVIKSIGDSFMVDFSSAVNAVKCGLDAQRKFNVFNKNKNEFNRIEIRIGIHLGDVIIRDNDIFGDGVNIAQRIEAITEPNRICVSGDIWNQVKNKMEIKGHAMGGMKLKNIAEPVDVFEILIPEIPELAVPSQAAREAISQKKVEASIQQEAEEAREAQHVEQAKVRVSEQQLKEEERGQMIEDLYAKAEKYFQLGRLDEAERALNEITALDPNYQATLEKRRDEDEKESKAQVSMNKAHELLKQRKLKEAEEVVSEVFAYFPLHVGAQQVLLQIEDERYRIEEEIRANTKSAAQVAKAQLFSEEDKKKADLFERARTRLGAEQFQEAIEVLREIFQIDPNNNEARLLEEEIRKAEEVKLEASKKQAEDEAERIRREQAETQQRLEDNEKRARAQAIADEQRRAKIRNIISAVVVIGLLAGLWFAIPPIYRQLFPRSASVAVVQFTTASSEQTTRDLNYVFAFTLAEDLARCSNVTVASPFSSLTFTNTADKAAEIAATLNARYIVSGVVKESGPKYSIATQVFDASEHVPVYSVTVETDLTSLAKARTDVIKGLLEALQVESSVEPRRKQTESEEAFANYMAGFRLSQSMRTADLIAAEGRLRSALDLDPAFMRASTTLADVLMAEFEFGPRNADLIRQAKVQVDESARNQTSPFALLTQGRYFRLSRRPDAARLVLEKSLALQPMNSDVHRELSLVALMSGTLDVATEELAQAKALDPKNPKNSFVEGAIALRKRAFTEADAAFRTAIDRGAEDSSMTVRYRISALIGSGSTQTATEFVLKQLERKPDDLFYLYMKGRIAQAAVSKDYQDILSSALDLARGRIDHNPDDQEAYTYAALLRTRLGNFEEGLKAVTLLGALKPDPADYAFLKARVYSIQKKKSESLDAVKEMLRADFDIARLADADLNWIAQEPEFAPLLSLGEAVKSAKN